MNINREHMVSAFIGLVVGIVGTIGAMSLFNQVRPAPIVIVPPEPTATPEATATPGLIRVYVNGAVRQAAVYELPPNSLVQQAIEAAGGFMEEANTAVVNLAQPLSDGLQIYVPAEGEEVLIPAPLTVGGSASSDTAEANSGITGGLININTASQTELEQLPGIGPSTAQNIIDHRDTNGPFAAIENIMDVSGIGEGRFEQIKELITVGE
jgi:competence protein ComEA